jgi:ABC-type transporter Mla subunit MlaD
MFGIIEIIIVLGIISIQLYLAYKLWFKIKMYRAIFDFEDLPIISQKNISKEVIQTGDVSQILQYVDNGEGVINITYLNYIPKSKVLSTVVKYINVYLIKNKGASIDFHLIKDIVDKHTQTIETQIENRIPAPLYLGLAATMIGIIAGLMSIDFSSSDNPLDAIQPLIDGIKWAMSASVIGLLITTFFSIKIYKDAQTEADEEKSEFLSKLQSELMPRMATGKLPEVSILSDKIDLFARATSSSVAQLSDIVKMSNKTIEHEQTLIKDIANLDVKGLSTANVKVFKNLDGMMDSFQNFAKYYNELDKSMSSTTELLSNLNQFVRNTQNVNTVLEEIKNSISQSNQATTFFNKHIQSFERYNDSVNVVVAKNDSAFQEAVSQLSEATQKQFDSFNNLISGFDSKLSEAFTQSVEIFTKTMDEQVRRTETAFETGRPKFEKLDNLDKLVKLEAIEDRLGSLETKLVNVISSGNKDLVAALDKGINSSERVSSKNDDTSLHVPKLSFINRVLPVFKIAAYTTIISYGIHTLFLYFDILNYIKLILK